MRGTDDPDSLLVAAAAGGDRGAFAELLERHYDRVHGLAWQLTGTRADADDIAQDVCCILATRIGTFRGEARFTTWLYRVTVNVFLDRRKSRRRFTALDETALAGRASPEPSLEATLIRSQVQERVARTVAALPVKLRVPVVLRYGPGLSYAQIAEALGVCEGTVASRLNRALKRLEHELRDVAG